MSVNASQLRKDVTVVLMGHDEPDHRERSLHYYSTLGVPCLALAERSETEHGAGWRGLLEQMLEQVRTPFVVLALDADFVLAAALEQAVGLLQAQPQVVAVQGYALAYQVGNAEVTYHKTGAAFAPVPQVGVQGRLWQYASAGQQAWRAVLRVPVLRTALADLPEGLDFPAWRTALSFSLLCQGEFAQVAQAGVIRAYAPTCESPAARDERLAHAMRVLRQWDGDHLRACSDDTDFALLSEFVRKTCDQGREPLLFTSKWHSVVAEPERRFEPRQYVELPYYNGELFSQLSSLEFLWHAWPTGHAQRHALEGTWVRQRDLLVEHPNDTVDSLKERYWQAQALGLFNREVCQRLLSTLNGESDGEYRREMGDWLERLGQLPAIDQASLLQQTASGQVLQAIAAATPDATGRQRVLDHLAKRGGAQIAFVVLDLESDDQALQSTFDSLLASGLRNFKLVVLKAGEPPALTTARDTLHFIQVTQGNWVSHLNQVARQLSSEWMLLMQAGDVLLCGALLRLQVELAEEPGCQAICANEVQRDSEGRLVSVVRPGADLDLLRGRPDLMSHHWLVRRQAVVDLGGYSEANRHALEFDLLLRLVEQNGVGSLAHMDEYLVIGQQPALQMSADAQAALNRHLTQLGYRAQVEERREGGFLIDYRHGVTPLVSLLIGVEAPGQLRDCLASVFQRTRYSRYEVLVACAEGDAQSCADVVSIFGTRARLVVGAAGASRSELLNALAAQARGEYVVLFSERCQVLTPAWIESLLNQALRPEVGVVGGCLLSSDGAISHAGFDLMRGPWVNAPWRGLPLPASVQACWPAMVRGCAAISSDCLMVRKELLDHCGGLRTVAGTDIDLCLRATEAGLLVVWTADMQVMNNAVAIPDVQQAQALQALWPASFAGRVVVDARSGVDVSRSGAGAELEWLAHLD
ncbi:glycosyl transferase [Pseudomonas sp. HLMP]|uniref:glycosyl transferase n=1 Tax=Pseudomonas sp. HLMP TaxID=3153767 RepID=UPI003967073A